MQACLDGRRTSGCASLRATAMSTGVTGVVGTTAARDATATVQVGPGGELASTPEADSPLYGTPGETASAPALPPVAPTFGGDYGVDEE